MHTATEDPLVGRTLEGRYRILDRIARGGMSTVYSAVDERLDRLVAVKVMSSALSADPAFSDRFSREARAAARLTHVNTVAVYDQGYEADRDGHHVFLVMELVQGRTLRELIRERRGQFSPAEALSLMQPVLSALSAAHRAGIVHRDIKPENILLSDEGVVKVADFGLARAVETDPTSTRTGLMMGTVAYCAPEQITRGHGDPRTDVYAAGIMLFELLTGRPPYAGESAMNVAYQHVHSRVPAPSSKVKGIPAEIDELVILATDPDPDERPTDAAEFLAEISDVRTRLDLPVTPVPVRPRGAAPRRTRTARPAQPNGFGGTTDLIGTRGVNGHDTRVVAGPRSERADTRTAPTRQRDAPPPPVVIPPSKRKQRTVAQRRRRRGLIALLIVLLVAAGVGVAGWWFAAGRYAKVPDVSGKQLSSAESTLRSSGFKVGSINRAWSETVPDNEVISTKPGRDARLVRGDAVAITISNGKYRIAVPSVQKLSLESAEAKLGAAGLPYRVTQAYNNTVPESGVVGTFPTAGSEVKKTRVIELIVSKGPPFVTVPSIPQGTELQAALTALRQVNFQTTTVRSYSDTVDKGEVISIDPSTRARKFSTVTVTVSKGPSVVTIPNIAVLTTSAADAQAQLEALGLHVVVNPIAGARPNPVLVSMSVAAGTQVPAGSTVTINVF